LKKIFILIPLFFITVFNLTSCEAHFGKDVFNIPCLVNIIAVAVILIIAHIYIISRHYKCPECGKIFNPKPLEFSAWIHCDGKRYVKCPECGYKGLCDECDDK